MLDKKHRGGKVVTLVTGLSGSEEELKQLAAEMKRRCGTGGTLKDGVIEIQGDHRDSLVRLAEGKGPGRQTRRWLIPPAFVLVIKSIIFLRVISSRQPRADITRKKSLE